MRVFGMTRWCGVWMLAFSATLSAQGVYVTQGDKGPVFSDKPQSGAKEVHLRPLSVVPSEKSSSSVEAPSDSARNAAAVSSGRSTAKASGADSRRDDAAPAYASFQIVSPEDGGSVIANTGAFDVRLAVDPSLSLGEGHAFVVRINGRELAQRFTSTELLVPAEFWGDAPPINQQAQIDAAIVDGAGRVLKRAAPVRFFLRYTTVLNRPHPLVPIQPYRPIQPFQPIQPIQPAPQVPSRPTLSTTGASSSTGAASGGAVGATIGKPVGATFKKD